MNCPSYEQLFSALSGSTGAVATASEADEAARDHVDAGCAECAGRVRIVRLVLDALTLGGLPAVPAGWAQRAKDLSRRPDAVTRARHFLAKLVLDPTRGSQLAVSLRGEGLAERHLLFRAGPYDVDLALLESGALVGQVLAAEEELAALRDCVCVLHGDDQLRETPLDENGDFHFAGVRPSAYDLVLESPSLRLLVPDVDLSQDTDARRE